MKLGEILEHGEHQMEAPLNFWVEDATQAAIGKSTAEIRQQALEDIKPAIRAAFLAGYARSGLKTRTGHLLNMINRITIRMTPTGILCNMPAGGQKREYVKAQSLQSGWVENGSTRWFNLKAKKGLSTIEGAIIHKARPYMLDEAQKLMLRDLWIQAVTRRVAEAAQNG